MIKIKADEQGLLEFFRLRLKIASSCLKILMWDDSLCVFIMENVHYVLDEIIKSKADQQGLFKFFSLGLKEL